MGNTSKNKSNCYFDIQVGEKPIKRLIFKLYFDDCPITCENFRVLCTGEKIGEDGKKLTYAGTNFHRSMKGFMAQGGDIINGDGTGGMSIYGRTFKDENFKHSHSKRGILSMANQGKNTNSSQFFILFSPQTSLDKRHVVFGEVVEGFDCLDEIESVSQEFNDHFLNIQIINSGQFEKQINK